MADDQNNKIKRFDGDLTTDIQDYHVKENEITHLRNGISEFGTGNRVSEPANKHCINAPYDIIGYIYLYEDRWLIYSTNDVNSEIGLFKEFTCEYSKLPGNFDCLNLSRYNLITGIAKQNFDCSWSGYWSDGYRNKDRTLNIDNIPYVGVYSLDVNGCQVFTPNQPLTLDCTKLGLNRLLKYPCVKVSKAPSGGNLLNGTYYSIISYTIDGQRVSDYLGLSNAVSLFSHQNEAGSIEINISGLDESFDEFELVLVSIVNQQTVATRMGNYSTRQTRINYDIIDNSLLSVPLEFLPIHNPLMDSSASISELGNNMLRIAPKSKFDFNYQPLANQIKAEWVSVEYPANYYREGGENPSFLEDENYAAFIQFIYDDGDLSSSYTIPGRAPLAGETAINSSINAIENITGATALEFEVTNTASQTSTIIIPIGDGGYEIARGDMGYYQTDERYPIDKPLVWGNLCGKNIRHHKFPERRLTNRTNIYSDTAISPITGPVIRIMAIAFNNIKPPVDNSGNVIPNIVGYRILRGSREGNKTIVAKGILNNMFEYALPDGKTGLYQNYPYNDLNPDPFISSTKTFTNAAGNLQDLHPNDSFRKDTLTFHSPDTTFRRPFLGAKELKLYGVVSGNPVLQFKEPDKHPKHKMATNLAFFIASIVGAGYAVLKLNGKRSTTYISPTRTAAAQNTWDQQHIDAYALTNSGLYTYALAGAASQTGTVILGPAATGGAVTATPSGLGVLNTLANTSLVTGGTTAALGAQAFYIGRSGALNASTDLLEAIAGASVRDIASTAMLTAANAAAAPSGFVQGGTIQETFEGGEGGAMGNILQLLSAGTLFLNNWSQGTNEAFELLLNFSQLQQYALQQVSACFYNSFDRLVPVQYRHYINNGQYLGSSFQELNATTKINNLYRASTVVLGLASEVANVETLTGLPDDSKQTLQTIGGTIHKNPIEVFTTRRASSHYAALKVRLRNQYGQIGNVKQIPIGCVNSMMEIERGHGISSPVIFGGDVYVTRYTEKNTMFFFYEWLYNQPDYFEYDYLGRRMLPYPSYWINSKKFDTGDFLTGLVSSIGAGFNQSSFPTGFRALDNNGINIEFVIKEGYFYLFNSGVRDFYVESEVNVGYRDWEEPITKHHYDNETFNSLSDIFDAKPDTIKADNFYKYDYSLSISKSFQNFASWANVQPVYYDPFKAETCYVFHPKRTIYSLPQQATQVRDSWRIFLANNYRDFRSKITAIKGIGLNGAVILFDSDSPAQIQGTETLETTAGTKLTIGDGELLNQPQQNLTNADREYQYGACQNLRSVVNTPAGLFWIGQSQGKVYSANEGIANIAMKNMQYWFARYLPYEILKSFPSFELKDNAITGVACQTMYDNRNAIIYFTKKDFKLRDDLPIGTIVQYNGLDNFSSSGLEFKLGDPAFFSDASWTASFDLKSQEWLSWHDWHPNLLMPSKNTFQAIKDNGIWTHNVRCDLYCNYFGVDYPFEIEWINNTVTQVNSIKSLEFQLEVYKYALNCFDKYLFLEAMFDEAIITNNEQCSGLLRLLPTPFNDPFKITQYPIYNLTSVDTLYSKVENKYRLNQFCDLTDDRGQFGFAQRMIWVTEANGYVKNLNPLNLNYQKDPTQRKRMRHYQNSIFLRRKVCGNQKFVLNFSLEKLQYSPR